MNARRMILLTLLCLLIACTALSAGCSDEGATAINTTNISPDKKVYTSEVDNSTALGAALMLWEALEVKQKPVINLGIKEFKGF